MASYVKTHRAMDDKHMVIMQRNLQWLEEQCECEKLASLMFSKFVFDFDDMQRVRHEKTTREQNKMFLSMLMMRGPSAFPVFLEALDKFGFGHVADKLREEEASFVGDTDDMNTRANNEGARLEKLEVDMSDVRDRVSDLESGELEKLKAMLKSRETHIQELQAKLKKAEATIRKNDAEIAKLRKELGAAHNDVKTLSSNIAQLTRKLDMKDRDIRTLKRASTNQDKMLKEQDKMLKEQAKRTEEQQRQITGLEKRVLPEGDMSVLREMIQDRLKATERQQRFPQPARGEASRPLDPASLGLPPPLSSRTPKGSRQVEQTLKDFHDLKRARSPRADAKSLPALKRKDPDHSQSSQ